VYIETRKRATRVYEGDCLVESGASKRRRILLWSCVYKAGPNRKLRCRPTASFRMEEMISSYSYSPSEKWEVVGRVCRWQGKQSFDREWLVEELPGQGGY